jgi:hypothetical protein
MSLRIVTTAIAAVSIALAVSLPMGNRERWKRFKCKGSSA